MRTKLILELGCNHNGSEKTAREMIDAAWSLGVWGIKFQKRTLSAMPEHLKYMPRDPSTSFGSNYYEHRAVLEFSVEQLEGLREYAEEKALIPIISVFDPPAIGDAIKAGFQHLKIPSQLYSNYAMNNSLCDLKKAVYLYRSTGMHTADEIINWQYFKNFDVTFYCRSIYPHTIGQTRIDLFLKIKNALTSGAIGYSSHDKNGEAVPHMVTLGARYVERHFTLDKRMKGSDHSTVSSDVPEAKRIIELIEQAEETIEAPEICAEELQAQKMYRGFY